MLASASSAGSPAGAKEVLPLTYPDLRTEPGRSGWKGWTSFLSILHGVGRSSEGMARPSTADTLSDIVLWHLRRLGLPIADYFRLTLGYRSAAPAAQMFQFWRRLTAGWRSEGSEGEP